MHAAICPNQASACAKTILFGEHAVVYGEPAIAIPLIGTRTFGGFSALAGAEGYTTNYAGHVGVQGVTPVFCYVPLEVALALDGQVIEGHGVDPDIEGAFDVATWDKGNGPDSQLDRALQFIK